MQTVDVADIFVGGQPNYYIYRLNGMVCYYGLHYHAFVRDAQTGTWRMFDDATASQVRHLYIHGEDRSGSKQRILAHSKENP